MTSLGPVQKTRLESSSCNFGCLYACAVGVRLLAGASLRKQQDWLLLYHGGKAVRLGSTQRGVLRPCFIKKYRTSRHENIIPAIKLIR